MKKLLTILFTLTLLLTLGGCSKKLPEQYDEATLLAAALKTIELANNFDYETIASSVREDLYTETLADEIKKGWDTQLSKAGKYIEYTEYQTTYTTEKDGYEYAVIAIACKYENDSLIYTFSYDEEYNLVGLYMK